ncbi:MAG: serine--tRNA ligase [Acidimicrobiales bacterium]|jgi:seryl-tRNA synthetase|nr:serine--tRNA ligase [Acidimicrobiales bacterium]
MLDIRRFRTEPEVVRAGLARRGPVPAAFDAILQLDAERLERERERDDVRAEINRISKEVGALHREGRGAEAEERKAESRALGERERSLDALTTELASQIREHLLRLPNLPAAACPDGAGEEDNVVLRREGWDPDAYGDHQRVPHWEIGAELGILDLERGAKLSGSMFVMYRKAGATLARALVQLALDRNADAFEEIRPPTLVKTETMVSTGHLPKFEEDAYHLERDDLWAIPTAEVPLTSLARDEILPESELPMRLMAHTSCFRREAGSAGRDTRGLLRVHEFDKVEILAYATPEQAPAVHDELLARAESVIADLGLAYRILDICTGDIGNSSARTWDIEVYAPGVDHWLEVSSVSWFSDYQARRANVRYRPAGGGSPQIAHTLNGSALAVPRVWAALVETHRNPDGTITVPEVLRPYLRGAATIGG